MKRLLIMSIFMLLILSSSLISVEMGGVSNELSSIKATKGKLPSWLSSEYTPVFNGISTVATGGVNLDLPLNNSARTIMVWIYDYEPNKTSVGKIPFIYGPTGIESTGCGISMDYLTNSFGFACQSVLVNQPVTDDFYGWRHYTMTLPSGGTLGSWTFYVDGKVLTGAKNYVVGNPNTPMATVATQTLIGKWSLYPTNMKMAELSIWNKMLSQNEINIYKDKRLKGNEFGLVALYHMNDNSYTLTDSCLNVTPKNIIATNTIQWTRRDGYVNSPNDVRSLRYCYTSDGADNNASATGCLVSTYPYTIEAWISIPALTSGQNTWSMNLASTTNAAFHAALTVSNTSGNMVLTGYKNNHSLPYTIGTLTPGVWIQASYVAVSPALSRLYYFGNQVGTDTYNSGQFDMAGGVINFGRFAGVYGKGSICEARVWNTARTQDEIRANIYSVLTGSETGLVHYYKFNEGTGGSVADLGSGNKPLTLYLGNDWKGRDIP